MEDQLNILSLREQIYTYLRKLMTLGDLAPGSTINIGEIAGHLGISKTPLRDALIHLEVEGFVTILPRRDVRFHDVYLDVSENELLKKFIRPIKHRLYDFPRQNYISEWEMRNCREHQQFIGHLKNGNAKEAEKIIREVHWSFDFQKKFIEKFYKKNG